MRNEFTASLEHDKKCHTGCFLEIPGANSQGPSVEATCKEDPSRSPYAEFGG